MSHDMNVTPLIDVLLTLLVIFMIITPRTPMGESALVPQPPKQNQPQKVNNRTVVVQVLEEQGQAPTLKINEQNISWQDLPSQLFNIYKTRAEKVMFVKADTDVAWQDVAQVIDIAHHEGVDKVGLITAKIEQTG